MPRLVVTGLNRSGTSAISHLVSTLSGATLLDDPEWAISGGLGALTYRVNSTYADALAAFEIVKCPRICEVIDVVASDYPDTRFVMALRDPRDVWASVMEKVELGRRTRMLENSRFGDYATPLDGFLLQLQHYYRMMQLAARTYPDRARIVRYERFVRTKMAVVREVTLWSGLPDVGYELNEAALGQQYGPHGHKKNAGEVRGVGRWRQDVDQQTAAQIMRAVGAQYDALIVKE